MHTKQKHQAFKALKDLGYTSRNIAQMVLGDASKKSTVNDYLSKVNSIPAWPFGEQINESNKSEDCFSDIVDDLSYYSKKPYKQETVETGYYKGFGEVKDKLKIMVVPDTQVKPNQSTEFLTAIGQYLVDKMPDVVVMLGDFFDMESLSSYDKGKTVFEGRRVLADIEAGKAGMKAMLKPLRDYQKINPLYKPRMVFTIGNHDSRIQRIPENNSEYDGLIGYHMLGLEDDWEVHEFLKPVNIAGFNFVHYLTNHMSGKPLGGNALSMLKSVGTSFVVGHKQTLDFAMHPTLNGDIRIGIVAGASYVEDESYKGKQGGNSHYRGILMLHEAKGGFADVSFVSTNFLIERLKTK